MFKKQFGQFNDSQQSLIVLFSNFDFWLVLTSCTQFYFYDCTSHIKSTLEPSQHHHSCFHNSLLCLHNDRNMFSIDIMPAQEAVWISLAQYKGLLIEIKQLLSKNIERENLIVNSLKITRQAVVNSFTNEIGSKYKEQTGSPAQCQHGSATSNKSHPKISTPLPIIPKTWPSVKYIVAVLQSFQKI